MARASAGTLTRLRAAPACKCILWFWPYSFEIVALQFSLETCNMLHILSLFPAHCIVLSMFFVARCPDDDVPSCGSALMRARVVVRGRNRIVIVSFLRVCCLTAVVWQFGGLLVH